MISLNSFLINIPQIFYALVNEHHKHTVHHSVKPAYPLSQSNAGFSNDVLRYINVVSNKEREANSLY